MLHQISVTDSIALDLPAEDALAVLWDIQTLKLYDPKVDSAWVKPETEKKGTYSVTGRFAGKLWRGEFSYELNDHGFHSEMIQGPQGIKVNGGFVVKAEHRDRCRITHYEHYKFPYWMSPLALLARLYLYWAMKKELRDLAQIIYAKNMGANRQESVHEAQIASNPNQVWL
ncbi:MAG: SRPBCC family protein [bacterium]